MPIEIVNGKQQAYTKFGKTKKEYDIINEPVPHCIIDTQTNIRGWYQNSNKTTEVTKPRTCSAEYFALTPYRGCFALDDENKIKPACTFCYLPSLQGYTNLGVMSVDVNYDKQLRSNLEQLNIGFPAYISPLTDCFNPLEDVYHMTQKSMELFNEFNLPIMVCTKQEIPQWAYDELQKNKYSSLQVSLTTTNDEVWNKMAPAAESVETLLTNLATAHEAGIYTLLRIDPILPFICKEEDIEALVDTVIALGCVNHIVFSFAEFGYAMKGKVFAQYKELFPEEYSAFESIYSEKFGGNYIVDSNYRVNFFTKMCKKLEGTGITMSTCSELVYDETHKLQPLAKIHPEFQTSVSCHGIGVPIHFKNPKTGKFLPFTNCNKACLHCQTNPCGIKRLYEAHANTFNDYKKLHQEKEVIITKDHMELSK